MKKNIKKLQSKRCKGYTLIESVMAALIFALVMLYGFGFFTYGQKEIEDIKITSYATTLCKDAIDQLTSWNYYDLPISGQYVRNFYEYNVQFRSTCGVIKEVNTSSEKYKIIFSSVSYQILTVPKEIAIQTIKSPF